MIDIRRVFWGLLIVLALPGGQVLGQDSADAAVRNVFQGLQEKRPEVIWRALPGSYQHDLKEVIHEFGAQADAELWNLTFGLLNKAVRVLDEKREYIFQQPMIAARLQDAPEPGAAYDAVLRLLKTFTQSELSDVNQIRQLEPEAFLSGTVSRLMQQIEDLQAVVPEVDIPTEEFEATKITLVSSNGDRAVVRIEDESPEDREFVRVEGKWVPQELAEDWESNMAQARTQLAELAERQRSPETEQIAQMMRSVDGVLDQMLTADTAESFDNALQQLVGMVMFQFMNMGAEDPEEIK